MSLEERVRTLEDEAAVRDAACAFAECVNARDLVGFSDLWSALAEWEIGPPVAARAKGVDAIVTLLRRSLALNTALLQMTHRGVVRILGDHALAQFTVREHGRRANACFEHVAVSRDELARELDGKWRFTRRRLSYRYLEECPLGDRRFLPDM